MGQIFGDVIDCETAREVGADEDEDAFKKKLEKIDKAKPKDGKSRDA